VVEVAVAEPEASLAEMEIKAADLATRQALHDPRVHMLTGDVRNLLRQTTFAWGAGELRSPRTIAGGLARPSEASGGVAAGGGPKGEADPPRVPITKFDVVLLSTTEPSTLLASRLLTRESFAEARRALRPGGVLAFALPGAENYYSPELVARNGAIYKALASVFAHVVVTPLATNYFLASDAPLSRDPVELARRLRERKVTATFVDEYSLAVLMPEERVQSLAKRYSEAAVAASSDRLPTAYLHNLLVSGRADSGRVADLLRRALGLGFWSLALGLAVLLVVPALIVARGRQRPALLVVSMVGFASMASAVLILAVTQSALGVLHHLLGALLAANMAGLAFSAWGVGSGRKIRLWGALGLGVVVPALLPLLSRGSTHMPAAAVMGGLLVASLAAGAAVGIAFRAALVTGTTPAATYVVDLLGAALAAPVVAAVALPGFGLDAACALVALLAAPAALALAVTRQR
jgi:SAM-dependent methyltransferase